MLVLIWGTCFVIQAAMIFFIKNMVCIRCQMVVRYELEKLGLYCASVEAGKVEIIGDVSADQINKFKIALLIAGLELITDKKNILIEKIKSVISEMLIYSELALKTNFSDYLSKRLNLDYTYLANTFSENQGITIEHYIITNKIQRVKELICYKDLNLTEISWKLHYSSVAHLSTQFKKVTGVTPSYFKHKCNSAVPAEMCEL
jgi:YesN/AraC family two-component response regulator